MSGDQPAKTLETRVFLLERTMPNCDNCPSSKASKDSRERLRIVLLALTLAVGVAGLLYQIVMNKGG